MLHKMIAVVDFMFDGKGDNKWLGEMVKDAGNSALTRWDKNWLEFFDLNFKVVKDVYTYDPVI